MKSGFHIILCACLFATNLAHAYTVPFSGTVVDDKNLPVFTGNVVLFTFPDTAFVAGAVITEGGFAFEADVKDSDSLLFRCNVMGFAPKYVTIYAPIMPVMTLDTIRLDAANLKEVEIRAFAPVVQNKGNKLSVDVENSSLSAMGTAYEVLENTPGLMIGTDGNVTVFGRGTAILFLDGQRIPAEMLRSIPSIQISSIEIIKNPPASYDAQGRAVVNIVTKKKAMEGYNVDLFQAVSYTPNIYGYTGVNGYWRKNKFTVTGRMGFFKGTRWQNTLYLREFDEDSLHYTMRNEVKENREFPGGFYPGITFQYRPDSISHFDLTVNSNFHQSVFDVDNSNVVTANSTESIITTTRRDEGKQRDYQSTLGYTRLLDTLGSEIHTSVSWTDYRSTKLGSISQNLSTPSSTMSGDLRNTSENTIRFAVGQFSWTKCIDTAWKIETGAKYSLVTNGSEVGLQRLMSNGEWVNDSAILNSFEYSEQTIAAYTQGTFTTHKWYITAGLRAEYATTNGKSLLYGTTLIDTSYLNVFPMTEINYTIMKDLMISLDYSWSIERPSFQDLDPFIMFIDSLSYIKGNPGLRPEYIHDFSVELIYLEAASIGFTYAYTNQAMELFVERTGAGNSQFVGQERNFDYAKQIGFEIALPYQTSWWTTYNTAGYTRTIYHYDNGVDFAHNDAEGWFFFFYNKFSLKKHFSLEVMYWYLTGGGEGLFQARPMSSLRASLMFKSTDNNFTVRLICNDILYTAISQADSRIPGFDLYYREAGDSRYLRIALSYRFGKVKQQEMKERNNNDSERNRIKG
ncbi:MAG TPA: outer membrane beta-barrel family protein [Bacteroidia bacterium]|nr:outer membrane beta-barrel family protein [Bacteroidia bacterium]